MQARNTQRNEIFAHLNRIASRNQREQVRITIFVVCAMQCACVIGNFQFTNYQLTLLCRVDPLSSQKEKKNLIFIENFHPNRFGEN